MRIAALALVSIALLLLAGCAQKTEPVVQEPPVTITPQQNATEPSSPCTSGNVVQKDECFLSLAKEKDNVQLCIGIYTIEKLDSCYAFFASDSLEICKKITDAQMKAECISKIAGRQKKPELCDLIADENSKISCLKESTPPCMLVLDPSERSLCLALEKSDYTLCQGDSCFLAYALNKSDGGACGLITVPSDLYACNAVVKKSVTECNAAAFDPIRNACVEKASELLDDASGCDYGTPGSDYTNACYLYFAVKNRNMELCKKPNAETQRDDCYAKFALQTANVSSCARVIESHNKIGCYFNAASNNSMPSLCNSLGTEGWMRDCYSRSILIGIIPPQLEDCADVALPEWKNKCYFRVAKAAYNSTLCGFISAGPDKTSCDQYFGQ